MSRHACKCGRATLLAGRDDTPARRQRPLACVLRRAGGGMTSIESSEYACPRRTALRRWMRRAVAVTPVLAVCWTSAAAATTYYVRSTGSDGNDGLSPVTAFASVRPAARMLREP